MTQRFWWMVLPVGLVLLGGCSSGSDGAAGEASASRTTAAGTTSAATTSAPAVTAAPEPTGSPSTAAGDPDRCHTSELTGSLTDPDAGAGNRYATLVLTDTGGEVCTVYGYGGLGLVGPGGAAVPTEQVRVGDPAPTRVTLQPGQAVSATLHWTAVASGSEPTTGDCEPTPARLTVIPPDETDPLSVTWDLGPVCAGGTIDQSAFA